MVWIKEAEEDAIRRGETARLISEKAVENRAAFLADPEPTAETATAFIAPFREPVNSIVADLTSSGYTVEIDEPGFVHHSYQGESGAMSIADIHRYSMVTTEPSYGWGMTGFTKTEHKVFGAQWRIMYGEEFLGALIAVPVVSPREHLGGVEYRLSNVYHRVKTSSVETTEPTDETLIPQLQEMVGDLIRANLPQPAVV